MDDAINVLMGEYLIECDKDKIIWRLTDKWADTSKEFEDLDDLIRYMKREIENVDIES